MPYISKFRREDIRKGSPPMTAGELNFKICDEILCYLKGNSLNYRTFNENIGVLNCVQLEIYRRLIAPYEDQKCKENGDIFQ